MTNRFCDDHQWVGSQSESCPECDALWDSMSKGRSPMDTKSPTGRLTQSQPQLQELPKINAALVNGSIFLKLLREFEQAAVEKSWKGSQPTEDHDQIEADYVKAKAALINHVCNNLKG